ncbi:MAG: hypothetical protein HC893_06410, partial [Chloroflexaceae bacterium]|nr:hypothetical protein [Chloroflexaceae bacterium]
MRNGRPGDDLAGPPLADAACPGRRSFGIRRRLPAAAKLGRNRVWRALQFLARVNLITVVGTEPVAGACHERNVYTLELDRLDAESAQMAALVLFRQGTLTVSMPPPHPDQTSFLEE